MRKYDVCLCEPFILPGILPTLGTPTLKAVLNEINVSSRIFYPSLRLFVENKYFENEVFLKCISDIPLQFSEFLFNYNKIDEGILFLKEEIGIDNTEELYGFLEAADKILRVTVDNICSSYARVLSCSLTFGDYNFAFQLFKRVKQIRNDIEIVVGGSMCTPQLASEIMALCPEIDYVICDEDVGNYKDLINALLNNSLYRSDSIASKKNIAIRINKINDLNHLPCPDFSDFIMEIRALNLKKDAVIVPYEISRGCWWGERKSCVMCGYFGYQKCFLIKKPVKVLEEIKYLRDTYGINYIRFTDLVEPNREYLRQIEGLSDYNMKFFWELRPNIDVADVELIRSFGVFYSQIGFESLSTEELKYIHKGTTAINNIYLLILFMSYKIRIDWNYLYGFSDDKREWYESALSVMPLLHHLFPPDLRQVWINRESRIFNENKQFDLKPVGSKIFHNDFSDDIEVFYQSDINEQLRDVYDKLSSEISRWKKDFFAGYQLCIIYDDFEGIHILRDYGKEEHFYLSGLEATIYECIFQPVSIKRIKESFVENNKEIEGVLLSFLERKIAIFIDDKYLALATRSTRFKWEKYNLLSTIFE